MLISVPFGSVAATFFAKSRSVTPSKLPERSSTGKQGEKKRQEGGLGTDYPNVVFIVHQMLILLKERWFIEDRH